MDDRLCTSRSGPPARLRSGRSLRAPASGSPSGAVYIKALRGESNSIPCVHPNGGDNPDFSCISRPGGAPRREAAAWRGASPRCRELRRGRAPCLYNQEVSTFAPVIAIVGRPNVGKSTLFNRLTGSRRAIVGDEPGITRDRIYGKIEWAGRRFDVVDTGGIIPDDPEIIPDAIFRQARVAIEQASVILFVVDGRTALAAPDLELARLLMRTGKPVLLLVNKIESEKQLADLASFHELGLHPLYPISAEHSLGIDTVLDRVLEFLPPEEAEAETTEAELADQHEQEAAEEAVEPDEIRIAIIGRPNVGKSTLLNCLTGEERSIVSQIAGTTRDAVDALVERDGQQYRFVDTAGIRRKGKTHLMAEKLSVVMARKHLEQADVALIVLDASEGLVSLDTTIAGYAHEAARSCILVVNKWDLAREQQKPQREFEEQLREQFKFLAYAPSIYLSAQKGSGIGRLFPLIQRVAQERRKRISTAEMNRFLATVDFERAPVPHNQRVKVYYISQVAVSPPTFVLFIDKPRSLHFSYRRFLENQIRRAFGFEGTPIVIRTRVSGR